jgi:hypothetical protein
MRFHANILVSGYFAEEINNSKVHYFERVQESLVKFGIRLVFINLSKGEFNTNCERYNLSSLIAMDSLLKPEPLNYSLSHVLDAAACVQAQMNSQDFGKARQDILLQAHSLSRFCERNGIRRCLLWAQFLPLNIFARQFLEAKGIRCGFVHLGLLPGTISLMAQGEMAESWLCTESASFRCLPTTESDIEKANEYLRLVRTCELNRKVQPRKGRLRGRLKNIRSTDTLVFYAGINDFCSGVIPRWDKRAAVHSPFFEGSLDGLEKLTAIAEQLGLKVVYKAHPNISKTIDGEGCGRRNGVINANDTNVYECVDESDVTATILSQTAYLALIKGKPVVLMGRMPLSSKGCAYELEHGEQLAEVLVGAIKHGLTKEQEIAWYKHVAQLWKYALFSFDPAFDEIFDRGPESAALWLSMF